MRDPRDDEVRPEVPESPRVEQEDKSAVCEHSCEQWWRQDRLDAVGWGAAFIWAALVLLAQITGFSAQFSWWNGWGVFFIGAGVMALVAAVIRLQIAEYRPRWLATLIYGLITLAIGFGLGGWEPSKWVWVVALAAIGVIVLRGAFVSRR